MSTLSADQEKDAGVSEERVVAVCLCLSARSRSGRKGEQGLRKVRGKVQESSRRLCEG